MRAAESPGITILRWLNLPSMPVACQKIQRPLRERPRGRFSESRKKSLFSGLLAQAVVLGESGTRRRVVRRHHRIVGWQAPLLAVFLGRHVVVRAQMPLERLELFAVLEADDVVRSYRFPDRHRRLQFFYGLRRSVRLQAFERRMHIGDQFGQIGDAKRIVADISTDDVSAQVDEIVVRACHGAILISHFVSFCWTRGALTVRTCPAVVSVGRAYRLCNLPICKVHRHNYPGFCSGTESRGLCNSSILTILGSGAWAFIAARASRCAAIGVVSTRNSRPSPARSSV